MTSLVVPIDDGLALVVAQAAAGDETAFAMIIQAHHDNMTRVCFVICGDLDVADEAVQAAWLIIWHKLASLRDPDRLRPGSCRSPPTKGVSLFAVNGARPWSRSLSGISAAPGVDPALRVADLDLANALARLDADDRALLALRYIAGFDSTELGRAMGRSPSGTRARLARLLDRLRTELSDD